jgi:hypothetical protein
MGLGGVGIDSADVEEDSVFTGVEKGRQGVGSSCNGGRNATLGQFDQDGLEGPGGAAGITAGQKFQGDPAQLRQESAFVGQGVRGLHPEKGLFSFLKAAVKEISENEQELWVILQGKLAGGGTEGSGLLAESFPETSSGTTSFLGILRKLPAIHRDRGNPEVSGKVSPAARAALQANFRGRGWRKGHGLTDFS